MHRVNQLYMSFYVESYSWARQDRYNVAIIIVSRVFIVLDFGYHYILIWPVLSSPLLYQLLSYPPT